LVTLGDEGVAKPSGDGGSAAVGALLRARRRFIVSAPCSHLGIEGAEAGARAMLVACRLDGVSALAAE
jgi:hypothetical protein